MHNYALADICIYLYLYISIYLSIYLYIYISAFDIPISYIPEFMIYDIYYA